MLDGKRYSSCRSSKDITLSYGRLGRHTDFNFSLFLLSVLMREGLRGMP